MMTTSRLPAALITSFGMLLAISAASPDCRGQAINVAFIPDVVPPIDGDFNSAANWSDNAVPSANFHGYNVQDGLTARFFSGSTAVNFLTIGNTSFGRLEMTGGSLEVKDIPDQFEVGESVGGEGEVILTGMSTLTADGAVIGTRSKGLLSVGPNAVVDLKEGTNTRDLRVGSYGPAFVPGGPPEPGLDGNGLVDVQGTLNGATLIISQSGAKGEVRLSGGTVNLAGGLWMHLCEGCGTDAAKLALRSAKVSIIGSSGTFAVGGSDIRANSPTAKFSFTADAMGVTPIVANSSAEIDTAKLELNLDAFPFTPTSKLTLIDAIDTLLSGEFGTVTFLGNTTATVNYDIDNGDVFLNNFHRTVVAGDYNGNGVVDAADYVIWRQTLGSMTDLQANGDDTGDSANKIDQADYVFWRARFGNVSGAGAVDALQTGSAVPEPSSLMLMLLTLGLLSIFVRERAKRQMAPAFGDLRD